ncbi:MAG TPA: hypothetical protein PLD59_03835 [Tepidisphaeraceae bacterium]|nr:hypothetical protein [Tepidisphaeraceae bacterium]
MSISALIEEVEKLSPVEQEQFLRAVMDIVGDQSHGLTPAQQEDLTKRIEEADAHPDASIAWEVVKEQIRIERDHARSKGNAAR